MILQRMRPAGYLPKTTEKKMQKQNDSVNLQWNTDSSSNFKFFPLWKFFYLLLHHIDCLQHFYWQAIHVRVFDYQMRAIFVTNIYMSATCMKDMRVRDHYIVDEFTKWSLFFHWKKESRRTSVKQIRRKTAQKQGTRARYLRINAF